MRKLTYGLAAAALCAAAACGGVCEEMTQEAKAPTRLIAVQQERPASWAHICIFYDAQTKVTDKKIKFHIMFFENII